MRDTKPEIDNDWKDYSASAGPALLGCAAGVLLGELLSPGGKRPVILGLALAGVAALAPNAVAGAIEKVAGPGTRRGEASRLRNIRGATPGFDADEFGVEVEPDTLGV